MQLHGYSSFFTYLTGVTNYTHVCVYRSKVKAEEGTKQLQSSDQKNKWDEFEKVLEERKMWVR